MRKATQGKRVRAGYRHRHRGPSHWLWHSTGLTHKPGFSYFYHSTSLHFHFNLAKRHGKRWHRPHWWWYGYRPAPSHYCPLRTRLWYSITIYQPTTVTYLPSPRVQPVTHVIERPQPIVEHCPFTERQAWEFIAERRPANAHEAFECLAEAHPYDGFTQIGWAIAGAMVDRHDVAVQAMRHAISIEPDALMYVPADERIDDLFDELLIVYSHRMHEPNRKAGSLFMIASLRAMLGDAAGAHFAVSQAIASGDQSDAAHELRALLADVLAEELQQPG